jgi:general secretion pathway protein I
VAARGMISNEEFAHARRILLTEPDRTKLEQGGEFETADGRQLTWDVEITSSSIPDLFNVALTCEIAGSSGPQPEGITQTFVLLRPTWSIDLAERGKLLEEAKTRILEIQEGLVRR